MYTYNIICFKQFCFQQTAWQMIQPLLLLPNLQWKNSIYISIKSDLCTTRGVFYFIFSTIVSKWSLDLQIFNI